METNRLRLPEPEDPPMFDLENQPSGIVLFSEEYEQQDSLFTQFDPSDLTTGPIPVNESYEGTSPPDSPTLSQKERFRAEAADLLQVLRNMEVDFTRMVKSYQDTVQRLQDLYNSLFSE